MEELFYVKEEIILPIHIDYNGTIIEEDLTLKKGDHFFIDNGFLPDISKLFIIKKGVKFDGKSNTLITNYLVTFIRANSDINKENAIFRECYEEYIRENDINKILEDG